MRGFRIMINNPLINIVGSIKLQLLKKFPHFHFLPGQQMITSTDQKIQCNF